MKAAVYCRKSTAENGTGATDDTESNTRQLEGWICEKHAEPPWPQPTSEESEGHCAGPGMPCPRWSPAP